jgi:hypothetical protein
MNKAPIDVKILNYGIMNGVWKAWFQRLWLVLDTIDTAGTTAQRPTVNLYVGKFFYDTTLGKPIWLHSANPNVWHDGSGASV